MTSQRALPRKLLFGYGLLFGALLLGVFMTVLAQDAQRLQKEKETLTQKIAALHERERVLAAEWAYLTRPDNLVKALHKAAPDQNWVTMRGEAMVSLDELLHTPPAQVAAVQEAHAAKVQ